MTRTQGLLVVLTCVLLAAWLVRESSSSSNRGAGVAGAAPPAADLAAGKVSEQARRLRERLTAAPAFVPPHRNPFQFRERSAPRSARKRLPVPGTAPVERAAHPEMQLVGIADDGQDGGHTRTAIVSASGQLFFLKEGDRIFGRYEVVRIGADAAQLKDPDGQTFTIALK